MRLHIATLLSVLALSAPALADEAKPADKGAGYAQAGKGNGAGCEIIASANTATPIPLYSYSTGPSDACFKWGRLVNWYASGGEAVVLYAMTTTVSFAGNVDSRKAATVVDAYGPDGAGVAAFVGNGSNVDFVPGERQLYRHPGARAGVCGSPILDPGGDLVYPPCRVDADCSALGAGSSCITAPTDLQRSRSCALAVVQVDTNGTKVCWRVDE